MEQVIESQRVSKESQAKENKFIGANTTPSTLNEIRDNHTIPVFVKDNSPAISQAEFIELTEMLAQNNIDSNTSNMAIRVSHPIKGRTFEARHKKAAELEEHEKTIYYERMAFSFDFPAIKTKLFDQELTLSVIGIKAYNLDNLNTSGGAKQTFKVGLGFKVKVCTNLCMWSDSVSLDIKASNISELKGELEMLFGESDYSRQLNQLKRLGVYELKEEAFAKLLGRARMYHHLPVGIKSNIPKLLISDSQISAVSKAYFRDSNFNKNSDGSINLWNLYNLLTDSAKTSYIDTFLDREVNAFQFTSGIADVLEGKSAHSWFLS